MNENKITNTWLNISCLDWYLFSSLWKEDSNKLTLSTFIHSNPIISTTFFCYFLKQDPNNVLWTFYWFFIRLKFINSKVSVECSDITPVSSEWVMIPNFVIPILEKYYIEMLWRDKLKKYEVEKYKFEKSKWTIWDIKFLESMEKVVFSYSWKALSSLTDKESKSAIWKIIFKTFEKNFYSVYWKHINQITNKVPELKQIPWWFIVNWITNNKDLQLKLLSFEESFDNFSLVQNQKAKGSDKFSLDYFKQSFNLLKTPKEDTNIKNLINVNIHDLEKWLQAKVFIEALNLFIKESYSNSSIINPIMVRVNSPEIKSFNPDSLANELHQFEGLELTDWFWNWK